jgi:hypothetical protein
VTGAYDWLNSSAEDFLAQHLPAAAQRAGAQRATQVTKNHTRVTFDPPNRPLQAPVSQIPSTNQPQGRQRNALHAGTTGPEARAGYPDGAKQVNLNRIELEAMMKANPNDLMLWDGRVMTVAEALGRVLKGDGVEVAPAAPAPGQPGYQAGPNIRISQEPVNNLTQAQYDELSRTGHLQGVTNSENGRAIVRVSQGGSYSTGFTLDETGKVGPGRPMDLRDFQDPAAGS